jgi:hypothetical protein
MSLVLRTTRACRRKIHRPDATAKTPRDLLDSAGYAADTSCIDHPRVRSNTLSSFFAVAVLLYFRGVI